MNYLIRVCLKIDKNFKISTFKLFFFFNKKTLHIKLYYFACESKESTTFLLSYIPRVFHNKLFVLVHKYRRTSWVVQHKEPACNTGDRGQEGSTPELGRSPGEGNGNPLQYSFLEIPMNRGAWWDTVHGVTKRQRRLKWSSRHTCTNTEDT